jgi:hypothetical protein
MPSLEIFPASFHELKASCFEQNLKDYWISIHFFSTFLPFPQKLALLDHLQHLQTDFYPHSFDYSFIEIESKWNSSNLNFILLLDVNSYEQSWKAISFLIMNLWLDFSLFSLFVPGVISSCCLKIEAFKLILQNLFNSFILLYCWCFISNV